MKRLIWILVIVAVLGNSALLLTMTPETLPTGSAPVLTVPDTHPPEGMKLSAIKAGVMTTMASFAYRGGSLFEPRDFNMGVILVHHPRGSLLFD
ncbi:MAG: hypothetical protein ACRESW_06105, partial [Nevskiales bacterium]